MPKRGGSGLTRSCNRESKEERLKTLAAERIPMGKQVPRSVARRIAKRAHVQCQSAIALLTKWGYQIAPPGSVDDHLAVDGVS